MTHAVVEELLGVRKQQPADLLPLDPDPQLGMARQQADHTGDLVTSIVGAKVRFSTHQRCVFAA